MREKIALLLLALCCSPPTIDATKPDAPLPPPEPQFGTLSIEATPPATEIFIDGLRIDGITPINISLTAKEHLIELRRKFYINVGAAVLIEPDMQHNLDVKFISSLYNYTGHWFDRAPNVLPSGDMVTMSMDLTVEDNKIFGKDTITINDASTGSGICAGTISVPDETIDMLCYYENDTYDYWRSARYTIVPLSYSEISVKTVYIDSYHRLFLSTVLTHK